MPGYFAVLVNAMLVTSLCVAIPGVAQENPVTVSVAYPVATQQYQSVTLSGSVESAFDAVLAPLEAGVVAKLHVEVGDTVSQGQPLLELNSRLAELAQQQAEAELQVGKVALSEARRLLDEVDALTQQQLAAKTLYQQRSAAVANAEAQLSQLSSTLALRKEIVSRHTLTAPFDGVIYQRSVDVGEWIEPTTPALALVSQKHKRLSIEVPQEYYRYFNTLDSAITVTPDNTRFTSVEGRLTRLVAASGNQGRTFTAHISLPADTELLVGMSASAEVNLPNVVSNQAWLPASAIKQHPDGGASVFAVKNNRAERVLVNIVRRQGDTVLLENVSEQQLYVAKGISRLSNNTQVTITDGPQQ
ncbi:efflux RND transporter periplasmic adaptor subunit [Alteromonas gilva]|uniref:Efflux RND transporter periplasmic adaptor subunit n=1 Tax=Alteromonas gilva TaxID=2987522 RepID=A0ABT5L1C0_9ALTE|nr:efflux RND transporter periplasmic adaptor subunit [Alteromonas gilva]MDC8830672.1 efflux RND transporter periplasmic adaptor subunit [Alteromonas gilva]